MNIQARHPTTSEEFLRWNENRQGRREFVDGRVLDLMINTTIRQGVLALRLGAMLLRDLPYPDYYLGSSDVAVRTARGIRYPDVFVDLGSPGHGDLGLVAEKPVFLAEILSASAPGRDFVEKAAEYTGIPSLRFYLVASQEEPRIWLWERGSGGAWAGPREIDDREGRVALAGLDATVVMAELYAGIGPRP